MASRRNAEMPFADAELTDDGFLGGGLRILQPKAGYRAATDPVLLAAAVPARVGEDVLELGCGAGVASLCLAKRISGLSITGLELQPDYAELARRNAAQNEIALRVVEGDIARIPAELRAQTFDHVITNPPFYDAGGSASADTGRETALRESLPLQDWMQAGLRRLRPGGWLTTIHLAGRMADLLAALGNGVGSVQVLPISPRAGKPAKRVILRARKGARGALVLLPPLVIHAADRHLADGEDLSEIARAVLRDGAPLPF